MLKTVQELTNEIKKDVAEISVAEVRHDVQDAKPPYLLIDVREPNEVAAGTIPSAVAIPRGKLELEVTKVTQDENQPIVCYCGGGTRSLFAAQQLKTMGFKNVKSMAAGFRGWKEAGGTVAPFAG